jgi:hypothetical protein
VARGDSLDAGLLLGLGARAPTLIPGLINGLNEDVGATFEDIWDGGGMYPLPASAVACQVVSASAADTASGTGARSVFVTGIGASGSLASETATLAGTAPVVLTNTYAVVHSVLCASFGSGETNAGNVSVTAVNGGALLGRALAGRGTSQSSVFAVPAGYWFTLGSFFLNANNGTNTVEWRFGVRFPGSGGWVFPFTCYHGDNAQPVEFRPAPTVVAYPAGTVIKWQAKAAAAVKCSTGMNYVLCAADGPHRMR